MPKDDLNTRLIDRLAAREKPYEVRDGRVRGLLVRVQPNGRKLYYFEWKRGRRVALGEFPTVTLALARSECPRVLARVAVGDSPRPLYHRPAPKRPDNPSLHSLAEKYGVWFKRDRTSQGFEARSLEALTTALRDKDHPKSRKALGELGVRDLSVTWLEAWADEKRDRIRQRTIARQFSAVRSMLNWAKDEKLIEVNPLHGVTPTALGIASKANPDEKASDVRALTATEEKRLRAAIAKRKDYLKPLVLVALGTGMRRGELFRLRWVQIDGDQNTITIPVSKSGRRRVVNFGADTRKVLDTWRKASKRKQKPQALVFPGLDGNAGLVSIKRAWSTVRTEADLPRARFHDLRHTYASRHLTNGTPLPVVARLLGHTIERTTEIYFHLDPEAAKKWVEAASG